MDDLQVDNLKILLLQYGMEVQRQLLKLTEAYKYTGELSLSLQDPSNIEIREVTGKGPEMTIHVNKHLEFLDFGRKKGTWVPTAPLERWVSNKLRPIPSKLKSTTFLVKRAIFEKGIDPKLGTPGLIMKTAKINSFNVLRDELKIAVEKDAVAAYMKELKRIITELKLNT